MAKGKYSGYSRVVAVYKPVGMTSHDVVSRCRRIFGEKRVGHGGTLDPLASGVLLVCIGPATRLNPYLTDCDKSYRMGVLFGTSTTTDDSEGEILITASVSPNCKSIDFAQSYIEGLVGDHSQVPPVYSAIKVNGQKSYAAARKGNIIDLAPREFSIYSSKLNEVTVFDPGSIVATRCSEQNPVEWDVEMAVSKGTYMRAIARDIGKELHSAAHVSFLERTRIGNIALEECVTLEELEKDFSHAVIDPLRLIGCRFAFLNEHEEKLSNGASIPAHLVSLNYPVKDDMFDAECCVSSVFPSKEEPENHELVAFLVRSKLKALYRFDKEKNVYKPQCVFAIGVERGSGI